MHLVRKHDGVKALLSPLLFNDVNVNRLGNEVLKFDFCMLRAKSNKF
jgi:hypothetical protein